MVLLPFPGIKPGTMRQGGQLRTNYSKDYPKLQMLLLKICSEESGYFLSCSLTIPKRLSRRIKLTSAS